MAPRSLVSSDRIGDFEQKSTPGFCWRKSAKFSQAFVRRWGTVQLGCLDPGMTKSWGGFPYLKGADVWSTGGMKCEVFCGCGSVICCSRRSQVVAFRISFECFLVGVCFVSEKTSCWQPVVSPLDLFRFASVSWSHWFHFGIGNSQSPRSESLRNRGQVMCPTKHGWMAHDAAVVWCWNRNSKHRKLQNDTRYVSLFTPVDGEMLCH